MPMSLLLNNIYKISHKYIYVIWEIYEIITFFIAFLCSKKFEVIIMISVTLGEHTLNGFFSLK